MQLIQPNNKNITALNLNCNLGTPLSMTSLRVKRTPIFTQFYNFKVGCDFFSSSCSSKVSII
jgi:hypothetical protein